jgi:hypothetical protein
MGTTYDKDRDEVRRALKSGQFDPNTAHQPQEVRKHPTEGETMQLGDAAPGAKPAARGAVPGDDAILRGPARSVPGGNSDHGVLDPPEAGHPLPDGLERKRAGPLSKDSGRRLKAGDS